MRKLDWAVTLGVLVCGTVLSPSCQCGRLEIGAPNLIVKGQYQGLWGFPYGEDQKYVMADTLDETGTPTGALHVVDVARKTSCALSVERPAWFWSIDKALLVFEKIDWDRWTGRVSLISLPCGPARTLLENVYISIWREPDETGFYALVDVDERGQGGRLVRMAWPSGEVTEIRANQSTDFFDFDWPGRRYFYREGGALVTRTLDGREEGRMGSEVTYYSSSGEGDVLFQEGPRLLRASTDGTNVRTLSMNACSPTYTSKDIAFLEPCSGPRQLVVLDRATNEVRGHHGGAVDHFRVGPDQWLSWIEGQVNGEGPGTLWVKPPNQDAVLIGPNIHPSWHVLTNARVVLYTTPRDDDPRRASFIAHDLARGTKKTLAEDVDPALPASESPWSQHWAVVADLRTTALEDGGVAPDRTGALIGVHPTTFERIPVADAVPTRGWRFSWQAPALGYLRGFDPVKKVGALEIFSMIDRKKFPVDIEVREFDEVYAPRKGVAYIIDAPERSGIYFVEADLHLF